MIYRVSIRKGLKKEQATHCKSLKDAMWLAGWAAFLLDIKTKETLHKKEWTMWGNDSCFFEYDITPDKHKKDDSASVRIRSQLLPISLYGKNIKQIEKALTNK